MLDILVVDDEPLILESLSEALRDAGHRVSVAPDGAAAVKRTADRAFDVVISDVRIPKIDGLTLFRQLRKGAPLTDVILITAYGEIAQAVSALKEGAYDYLTKPVDLEELVLRVSRIDERRSIRRELEQARAELEKRAGQRLVLGRSPTMVRVEHLIQTFAQADAPVFIHGESGTGKELVARRVHDLSPRRDRRFVPVNCAALPETLLEAELFGHEQGAFTGATRKREGRFKATDGGTIFLDEIGELSHSAQGKLLRVLQEGSFEPLGSNDSAWVDVRVISATHRNLKELTAQGRFREDLYFRLKVLSIDLPPLRERRGDMPMLVEHFLREGTPAASSPLQISPQAWAALAEYAFPGNIRELEHALQHAAILARGRGANEIELADLPSELAPGGSPETGPRDFLPLRDAIQEFEREYLKRALRITAGKKTEAAHLLKMSRKSLWKRLNAYELSERGSEERDDGKDAREDEPG